MSQSQRHRSDPYVGIAPTIAAIFVATMASLVLIGWIGNIEFFKSLLHPDRIAMNPATAVGFLLLSVSLWIVRHDRPILPWARRVSMACASAALAIAICRLGEYAGIWNIRVDRILFTSQLKDNVMAPNTAASFAMISCALVIIDARRIGGVHPSQPLILLTAAIALLSLVGYCYNIASLYVVRGAIPMALNTAILFLVLSVGIPCSRPHRQPLATALSASLGGVVARRLIPTAFFVPLLMGGLLLIGVKHRLYGPAFGMTLFVLITIFIFNLLIWWSARIIHRTDVGRERTADELRLSERRYHAIMRQTGEGIYLVDLDTHRIIETNSAMTKMLGYAEGELDGQSVTNLVSDSPEHVLARLNDLKARRIPLQCGRQYKRKDGTSIDVYAGATVISYGDRTAACTVLHDETERNRAVQLLQEKHDQLEKAVAAERAARAQLQLAQSRLVQSEKLASLGQMVAGVAHEINNPLSFVSNNVAVLQRDTRQLCDLISLYGRADGLLEKNEPDLLAAIRELAEQIDLAYTQANLGRLMDRSREGLRRIQQIVKDLRDFARLDESDLHEVDLNTGIESTVNIVVGRAKKKRVEIRMDLKPLPLVSCYPAKINQVVMNLVANAIDACPEGGKVTVQSSKVDHGVRIIVTDNGTGVPPAIRERIFDPFFTTKPQGEGTGLGLSISYGIINDHGGQIEISDAPEGGAVFTVTIPLVAPPREKNNAKPAHRASL